jgi:hypothetical protein
MAIIKNKGTPNLLNSSDNIDGTQTFLTQLSAVKLKSIEKRGKIQTTKMAKFSNLNICSTKREPNLQWPLTATMGLNFWSKVGSPIPMNSQWPQTAFARLFLICSLLLDLSSTGLIKKEGTQCFKSSKRESYPNELRQPLFGLNLWSEVGSPIPMTSNRLSEAVTNMFPSSWPEQYWSDQREGNPMLQIKKKGTLSH